MKGIIHLKFLLSCIVGSKEAFTCSYIKKNIAQRWDFGGDEYRQSLTCPDSSHQVLLWWCLQTCHQKYTPPWKKNPSLLALHVDTSCYTLKLRSTFFCGQSACSVQSNRVDDEFVAGNFCWWSLHYIFFSAADSSCVIRARTITRFSCGGS